MNPNQNSNTLVDTLTWDYAARITADILRPILLSNQFNTTDSSSVYQHIARESFQIAQVFVEAGLRQVGMGVQQSGQRSGVARAV